MKVHDKVDMRATNRLYLEALNRIRAKNPQGLLVVREVIAEAADLTNPLHVEFEWDNEKAGPLYREIQARELIRRIEVEYATGEGEPRLIPAFVSLKDDRTRDGGGYRSSLEVLSHAELAEQWRRTAERDLKAWAERNVLVTDLVLAVCAAAKIEPPEPAKRRQQRKRK